MDYYYRNIDVLKTVSMDTNEDAMIDEIWLGLPPNFHVHLQYNHVKNCTLSQFGQLVGDKDLAYREMVRSYQRRQDSQFDRKDKLSGQGWNNARKENRDDGKRKN